MNYFALPIVGHTFESIARAQENERWIQDWNRNVRARKKDAYIRYPMRSGTSPAVYQANAWRSAARTTSSLLGMW